MGRGESTIPEQMEYLYKSICSWGKEDEEKIAFPDWNLVYEYRDPFDPKSLSFNFASVLPEVESLLNYYVEWTVIFNKITQEEIRSWKKISIKLSSDIDWIESCY